jgi:ADP-dependent NAD(P)H-hydrate dehydratase
MKADAAGTVITPAVLRGWPLPMPGDGKESRGHLLVVAGTVTTPGAARLAAEAALRAGAGKLTIATTAPAAATLAVALPEALVEPLPCGTDGSLSPGAADAVVRLARQADGLLVGPGFTDPEATVELLADVLPRLDLPLVLDATASAYLGRRPTALRDHAGAAVLTVNPDELALTAHRSRQAVDADPAPVVAALAATAGVVVLCGGTEKHVACPDGRAWVFQGGGPGLGVSGSGDVQAGIVAGLLARGAPADQAAVWAGYLHGRTGERLASEVGAVGFLARELLDQVPRILVEIG